MKILITGGTGLIGKSLVEKLRERGHTVNVLIREGQTETDGFLWSFSEGKIDDAAFNGIESIIHLAGAPIAQHWSKSYKDIIIRSRTESADFLLNECKKRNIRLKSFVSASGVHYHGATTTNQILTEKDGILRNDFLSQVCQKWENATHQFGEISDRVVILRTAAVLSKNGGAFLELNTLAERNLASGIGSGKQWFNWIHIDDMLNMYVEAVENPEMNGTYNAVADEIPTNKQFMKKLAKANRKFFMPFNVPGFMMKLALGEMSEMLLKGTRVSNEKIKSLGFDFKYSDLDSAFKNLV